MGAMDTMSPLSKRLVSACLLASALVLLSGCQALKPRSITANRWLLSEELRDGSQQVQRGEKRPIIDGVGWVLGIPSKIILWNRRIDNHNISLRTEEVVNDYLVANALDTTRVRINQYAPGDDWRRLVRNKRVAAPWRYTFGAVTTLYETVLPGRLIGGDHYNPYTDTIHLYSDVPAIGLHEAAHAKDFARRQYKGTYAAAYVLPFVPLVHESIATGDALAYSEMNATPAEHREAYNVLYPAYGTYVGSALGSGVPRWANPLYYGSVIGGHIWGRSLSAQIPDTVTRSEF
ncbi:MAG: hypothetical protein IT423_19075 [Pirellulaceae bacterium]|nr:hypothetical protein [Pirellulaceae bacterium]